MLLFGFTPVLASTYPHIMTAGYHLAVEQGAVVRHRGKVAQLTIEAERLLEHDGETVMAHPWHYRIEDQS